jgi:predicted anti-sigma-YlaC factor YlaD
MARILRSVCFVLSRILFVAAGLVFFQGRIVLLFMPKNWGVQDTILNGLIASFTIAPLLGVMGLPFHLWYKKHKCVS